MARAAISALASWVRWAPSGVRRKRPSCGGVELLAPRITSKWSVCLAAMGSLSRRSDLRSAGVRREGHLRRQGSGYVTA